MIAPALSVVVPTLNEERAIGAFLERVSRYLESRAMSWEIIVVDDGSTDGTVSRVERWMRTEPRVRLVARSHFGKGSAVRHGMMVARGAWRIMADADLSVVPEDWSVLLDAASTPHPPDVILASREAAGARRIGEPLARHLIGRVFNWIVQALVVPGIYDTQCGFKLFSAAAAAALFPRLTIDGFAFDVELLFLSKRAGLTVREVGVIWTCRRGGRVNLRRGALAFLDIVSIRWNHWRQPDAGAEVRAGEHERPHSLDTVANDPSSTKRH